MPPDFAKKAYALASAECFYGGKNMERYSPYISKKQKIKIAAGILISLIGLTAFAANQFGRGIFRFSSDEMNMLMDGAMFILFFAGIFIINIPEKKQEVDAQIASGVRAAKAAKMKHRFGLSAAAGAVCTAALYHDHISIFCDGKENIYPLRQMKECVYFKNNEIETKCRGFSEDIRRQLENIHAEHGIEGHNLLFSVHTESGEKTILLTSKKDVYLMDKLIRSFCERIRTEGK